MYLNEAKDQQTKDDLALIIKEVLEQRYRGVKNEVGVWITPAFPKLVYTIEEDNCREGTKYWYLTKLAAKCSAKRLVPDYISEKKMIEFKGACFPCMGCRSFLPAWKDAHVVIKPNEQFELNGEVINSNILWDRLVERGEKVENNTIVPSYDIIINHTIINNKIKPCHVIKLVRDKNGKVKINLESEFVFYGRWNQGVCTINLPYAALEAIRNVDSNCHDDKDRKALYLKEFWKVFDHYSELVHEALQTRHARLLNTNVEISPLHWMYGGLARLPKNGTINDLLFDSFSSISYGYAGLYECVYALTGHSHTDNEGKKLALEILQKLNDYCDKWKKRENIGYSVYGSPKL